MIIIDYRRKFHKEIIRSCTDALLDGKSVVFPTDTSYGLAVDATNLQAITKLYQIKGRSFKNPVHVIVPCLAYARKIAKWNKAAERLSRKFWPGAVTLVLRLKISTFVPSARGGRTSADKKDLRLSRLATGTGSIGFRYPKNQIALDLAKFLKRPITATSANISGKTDNYSAEDIIKQFQKAKLKPDIVINAGKLPRRQPSTVVKITEDKIEILRPGPISEKQIKRMTGLNDLKD